MNRSRVAVNKHVNESNLHERFECSNMRVFCRIFEAGGIVLCIVWYLNFLHE